MHYIYYYVHTNIKGETNVISQSQGREPDEVKIGENVLFRNNDTGEFYSYRVRDIYRYRKAGVNYSVETWVHLDGWIEVPKDMFPGIW